MYIRTPVQLASMADEIKLRQNDHKGHWKECDIEYLIKRLDEEILEFNMCAGKSPTVRSGMKGAVLYLPLTKSQFFRIFAV